MKKGPYPLEAPVKLPGSLLLGPEFLGLMKPAVISGVALQAVLPNFKFEDGNFTAVLHPRAKAQWVKHYQQPAFSEYEPFGDVSSWNPRKPNGGIELFWTPRLLLLSKGKVTEAQARKVVNGVDEWVRLLGDWIEVIARTDLTKDGVDVRARPGDSADVWLNRGKGVKGKAVRSLLPVSVVVQMQPPLAITPPDWGRILKRASAGASPPEAHLFLRDARRALNSKHSRRAVLDAATAAEVALAKLRDDQLVGTSPDLDGYIQNTAQQISRLVGFLKQMGVTLPERIQQEIGEPRNRAIHEGEEPDQAAAGSALRKAEEVLDLAYPWKKLL